MVVRSSRDRALIKYLLCGAASVALSAGAVSQESDADASGDEEATMDVVVVSGLRQSLAASQDRKRNATGVLDAITAEDIGKFPDTNLAESLQRITGVSIDRQNGEGDRITVRGWSDEFNLVLLNGRNMPTTDFNGGDRSFPFQNIASDGIAGVDVFKTVNVALPTGGIGSTVNLRTLRPFDIDGFRAVVSAKAIFDDSVVDDTSTNPELSGLVSNTFDDGKFGVLFSASYQDRESGAADARVDNGYRGAYLGSENNWGSLAQPGTPGADQITNRPGPTDVYGVPQDYRLGLFERKSERTNAQLVLQYRPIETVEATLDYTYTKRDFDEVRDEVSVWFNHGNTTSIFGDGPVSDILFYSEDFGGAPSDYSIARRGIHTSTELSSLGFNVEWEATERLSLELDFHDSTSETLPNGPNIGGSLVNLGAGIFNIQNQSVNFGSTLPVLQVDLVGGVQASADQFITTGNVFQADEERHDVQQLQLHGDYDLDLSFIDSVEFGAAYLENSIRAQGATNQNNTWGGVSGESPASTPDNIFTAATLAGAFDGISGADAPGVQQLFFTIDPVAYVNLVDSYATDQQCGGDLSCVPLPSEYDRDSSTVEETVSFYVKGDKSFDLFSMDADLSVGLRYEETSVESTALVPIPTGVSEWRAAAGNELDFPLSAQRGFTTLEGEYDYLLPSIDFRIWPREDVVLRASYGQSITRPAYSFIQGGQTVASRGNFNIGGTGNQGDPGLLPFESENFDVSAEWYYGEDSYVSIGWFKKDVENFIGSNIVNVPGLFGLTNPARGPRAQAAADALGIDLQTATGADIAALRDWIVTNTDPAGFETPVTRDTNGFVDSAIFGLPEDPGLDFQITTPINEGSGSTDGFEFNVQHMFGDTGWGAIFNYTIVDGDFIFDNTLPQSVTQFALTGLSDTANVVVLYDKGPLQARLTYNWRDEFLDSTVGRNGSANNPVYTEAYGQFDLSASYDVTSQFTIFAEGINITDEYTRDFGRSQRYFNALEVTGSRWAIGGRYNF